MRAMNFVENAIRNFCQSYESGRVRVFVVYVFMLIAAMNPKKMIVIISKNKKLNVSGGNSGGPNEETNT